MYNNPGFHSNDFIAKMKKIGVKETNMLYEEGKGHGIVLLYNSEFNSLYLPSLKLISHPKKAKAAIMYNNPGFHSNDFIAKMKKIGVKETNMLYEEGKG
ncbi:hypothetical protein DICVIV_03359 [Dictyocaulus viviparus]|uniref:Uncharacterized protein n=1 Tax=Dictyocaulus viviparus TaxID=29172 RepID=A0A0D8Y3A7_DICVI|nr:hypothetical protein DICVIV_03359 [Dictyocaulus viviparus]